MATKKQTAPSSRRITLEIPAALYDRLEALATDERRELKPQLLLLIERGVKMHEGKKQATATRKMVNRLFE